MCYYFYMYSKSRFRKIANRTSDLAGSPKVFLLAILIVGTWAMLGPVFNYSNTWQLAINSFTTIVTFLMVFLIQNTQNRDGKAMQVKLDELIRSTKGARLQYIGLEDLSDEDIALLDREFKERTKHPSTARALAKLHAKVQEEQHIRQEKKVRIRLTRSALDNSAKNLR